ncbi:uncharacterized protein [Rhodnius prolixus]|uniref:uncharacterized protein n=1 Tax=Rhodnius prolixus TaxID=13249 RepID=UPI003D18C4FA
MILEGRFTVVLVFGLTWINVECGFAPALPSGRRTQYYYIYEDGAYKYGYDTGEGSYGKAVASPENEVQGDYAYQGPDGKVDVKYTAGKNGFVPDGFLPSPGGAQRQGGQLSPHYYKGHGGEIAPEDEGPGDASYSFSYNVGDQSRQEVSDEQGNVQGSYTYVAKDGSTRKVDYEAGAEKGFIIKGISPDAGGGSFPSAGISNPDGSYSFSYTAGDHSRHESTDANRNVVGSFSFVAKDDGLNRQVDYTAGMEKGFLASGSHLPQPVQPITSPGGEGHQSPVVAANRAIYQGAQTPTSHGTVSLTGSSDRAIGALTGPLYTGSSYPGRAHTGRAYPGTPTASSGGLLSGRAYEFSYDAGDHTRHESSDANGNVVGSFSFIAKDDKVNRKVDYSSSAENGFQAFGAHLPVPPVDGTAALHHGNIGRHFHAASPPHPHVHTPINAYSGGSGVPATTGFGGASGTYFPHGTSGPLTKTTHPAVVAANSVYTSSARGGVAGVSDGSYSFSYDAGDHTRQESSDSAGNVVGSFTFVAKDDGVQRKVDYAAGAERGFTAAGNHLPLQPDAVAPAIASSIGPSSYDSSYHHDPSGDYNPQDDLDSGGPSDASYSFSYNAGDHTRQESSDAFGNVVGSFSFLANDDGLNRQVDYESGAGKGFIASGGHLPSAFTYSATLPATGHYSGTNIHGSATKPHFHNLPGTGHSPTTHVGNAGLRGASNSFADSKALVKTFLTPNAHHKFGYLYDSQ